MKKQMKLIYEPEVGMTIPDAFARAIIMARKNGLPVHAIVNDIEMDITAKTKLVNAVTTYRKKNRERFEATERAHATALKPQPKGR